MRSSYLLLYVVGNVPTYKVYAFRNKNDRDHGQSFLTYTSQTIVVGESGLERLTETTLIDSRAMGLYCGYEEPRIIRYSYKTNEYFKGYCRKQSYGNNKLKISLISRTGGRMATKDVYEFSLEGSGAFYLSKSSVSGGIMPSGPVTGLLAIATIPSKALMSVLSLGTLLSPRDVVSGSVVGGTSKGMTFQLKKL